MTPRAAYVFNDVMIERLSGPSSALSLNFTKVELVPSVGGVSQSGVDVCPIEQDGILPPSG